MYPCTFQFRGGKGILSGGAIAIMIDWRVALVVWGGFIILAVATRYVSLGSCWAGLSFPFVSAFVYRDALITWLSVIVGGLILWKHRQNIVRLVKGTESKFTLHKKSAQEGAASVQKPAEGENSSEGPQPPEEAVSPERTQPETEQPSSGEREEEP